jgi:hypothetical protein
VVFLDVAEAVPASSLKRRKSLREKRGQSKFQNQVKASGKSNISMNWTAGFCGFCFVEADSPNYSRWATRLPYLDLSWRPLRRKYDKRAGRIVIRDFRTYYFGKHKRLTKDRCEEFFSNDRNFISR